MVCVRGSIVSGGSIDARCGGEVLKLVVNGIQSLGYCLK